MNIRFLRKTITGAIAPVMVFVIPIIMPVNAEAAMRVWFDIKPQGNGVIITPFVEGAEQSVLRYELKSETHGIAGNAQIMQSGGISTQPDQPTPITRLRMSPTQSGECEVTLKLFEGDKLVTEKKLTDCRPAI